MVSVTSARVDSGCPGLPAHCQGGQLPGPGAVHDQSGQWAGWGSLHVAALALISASWVCLLQGAVLLLQASRYTWATRPSGRRCHAQPQFPVHSRITFQKPCVWLPWGTRLRFHPGSIVRDKGSTRTRSKHMSLRCAVSVCECSQRCLHSTCCPRTARHGPTSRNTLRWHPHACGTARWPGCHCPCAHAHHTCTHHCA